MRELGALKFVVELMMSARHTHIRSVSMCCVAHCVFGNCEFLIGVLLFKSCLGYVAKTVLSSG